MWILMFRKTTLFCLLLCYYSFDFFIDNFTFCYRQTCVIPFIDKSVWSHLAMWFWSILIVCLYNGLLWFKWSLFPCFSDLIYTTLTPHTFSLFNLWYGYFGHCSEVLTLGVLAFAVVSTWNIITQIMNYSLFIHFSRFSSFEWWTRTVLWVPFWNHIPNTVLVFLA